MAFNYSGTKCPKCGNATFEMVEDAPTNSEFKFNYIRCYDCKTFLTAEPFYDIYSRLQAMDVEIKEIKRKTGA